jgi:UDP-N-acetyl-D-glucosamine dehydrogenase
MSNFLNQWDERVAKRETHVGIIGLGYVGLPLALLFSEAGFRVTGLDIDADKVTALNAGESYIHRIEATAIAAARARGFHATANFAELTSCDAVLLCVPTPLTGDHEPDMSFVENTVAALAPHTRRGQLIVLESTTWPGTTTEIVVPALERLGPPGMAVHRNGEQHTAGSNDSLYVAFSPEREDPGNTVTPRRQIPKVVGGISTAAAQAAAALYGAIFDRTVIVSSTEAAEMTKLLENIYRGVNIALVNELKQLCLAMNIDIWEVIDAASTKPFGFAPFYPGPGIGGHCIPVDPFYLSWRAHQFQQPTRFIELAGEVNEAMPAFVVATVARALQHEGKLLAGSKVLLLGIAYKRDVDDLRESPALVLFSLLQQAGAHVAYNDPFFPSVGAGRHYAINQNSTPLEHIGAFDCVLLVTDHSAYNVAALVAASKLFVDTRNATRGLSAANIIRC